MAEWFKAPVLKTGVGQLTVGSNPSLSADLERLISEITVFFILITLRYQLDSFFVIIEDNKF